MYTVKYEEKCGYYSTGEIYTQYFPTLEHFESWMFDRVTSDPKENMYFSEQNSEKLIIWFLAEEYNSCMVCTISNDKGIVFSNGQLTNGITHCSKSVRKMMDRCIEKQKSEFKFVEEE